MRYSIYIFVFLWLLQGCEENTEEIILEKTSFEVLPYQETSFAGDSVQIQFKTSVVEKMALVTTNAFGSIVLKPNVKNQLLTFKFPSQITNKAGICHWALIGGQKTYKKGEIIILPNTNQNTQIESYLGPRSINAGVTNYSMLTIAPTDKYDNPLPDGTEIKSIHQFKGQLETKVIYLKNLIGWTNFYATEKTGRILVSASCNDANAKEFTTIVYPANAADFTISYERNHDFADGNQIITFVTDIITDKFGNLISDGTLVSFTAINSKGIVLQTSGSVLNGIAKASLLHPSSPDIWQVTAYITGAAKSKTIIASFKPAINEYQIQFSEENRTVQINNIQSFMGQIVPDGIPISMKVKDEKGILIDIRRATSRTGKAEFIFSKDFYKTGNYELNITVAGIQKTRRIRLK